MRRVHARHRESRYPGQDHLKEGPLSPEEWDILKTHTLIGGRKLHGGPIPVPADGRTNPLTHHERWDGSGYPVGLAVRGDFPSREGSSTSATSTTLCAARPYKKAIDHEEALAIIENGDGRTEPRTPIPPCAPPSFPSPREYA